MYCILAIFHEFVTFLHEFGLNFSVGYFWAYLGHFSLVKWGKTGSGRKGTQISSREEYVFFFWQNIFICSVPKGNGDTRISCEFVNLNFVSWLLCSFLKLRKFRANSWRQLFGVATMPTTPAWASTMETASLRLATGPISNQPPTPAPLNPTQPPPSPLLKTHPTEDP